jgi:type II secretory pathway pseudopilin PulG
MRSMARCSRVGRRARAAGSAHERGFAYIGLLIAIVIIGAALAMVGEVWSTEARREREAELIFRGDAIRSAISDYLLAAGGSIQYPRGLEDLVLDPRFPQVRRHLRRVYADPMTGRADWKLIMAPDGGIMGVASRSQLAPIKQKRFEPIDSAFEDAKCYCDWQFIALPPWRSRLRPTASGPGS